MNPYHLIFCFIALTAIERNALTQKYKKGDNITVDRQTTVFLAGEEDFDFFRIPAMISAGDQLLQIPKI